MTKIYLLLATIFSSALFSQSVNGVYYTDPLAYYCEDEALKKFPAARLIFAHTNSKDCNGSATQISDRHVLTAQHVVSVGGSTLEKQRLVLPQDIALFFRAGQPVPAAVKKIHIYAPEGCDKSDDIALLELDKPAPGITIFPAIKALAPEEQIHRITLMGFGKGGCLASADFPREDIESFFLGKSTFRYVETSSCAEKNEYGNFCDPKHAQRYTVLSQEVKTGGGDSGGAVLDKNNHLIGVSIESVKKGANILNAAAEKIENAPSLSLGFWGFLEAALRPQLTDQVDSIGHLIGALLKKAASRKACLKIKAAETSIYTREMAKASDEIQALFKEGKSFRGDFLAFDEEVVAWIRSVISPAEDLDPERGGDHLSDKI